MAKLFECDKCKKSTTSPLRVKIVFERTPEEIQELMAAQDMPLKTEYIVKQASLVNRSLELCRKCYDAFIRDWNVGGM